MNTDKNDSRPRQALLSRKILCGARDQTHDGVHASELRHPILTFEARYELDGWDVDAEYERQYPRSEEGWDDAVAVESLTECFPATQTESHETCSDPTRKTRVYGNKYVI